MDDTASRPAFGAIGLTELEERIYRLLIEEPGISIAEISRRSGASGPSARRSLRALQDNGLASRSPAPTSRFFPAPPEVALSVLVHRRIEEVEMARVAAARLQAEFRRAIERGGPSELVEVASGRDAYVQRFVQLQRLAKTQVRILDKPPYADRGPAEPNVLELQSLQKGIRYRTIYDRAAFEIPGFFGELRELVAAGEHARTLAVLPMKLAVADEALGLIPLRVQEGDMAGLIVHSSPLLDGVVSLFELLWERSSPIQLGAPGAGTTEATPAPLSDEDYGTLALLSAGVTDDAAARQLGIASRTFSRRIRRVLRLLGVTTRFQAGAEAMKRGWI